VAPDLLCPPAKVNFREVLMHYLVTGGAGFIGSNTVDELVRRGNSVTVLDDLSAGKEANLS
jgi:nucleoside-diphosphate-sugar epimerase